MARRSHKHEFVPERRVNRIVISRCQCGVTKTDMIKNFSKEMAQQIDEILAGDDEGQTESKPSTESRASSDREGKGRKRGGTA